MSLALTTFTEAMEPSSDLSIEKWGEGNVILPHSIKSPNIDYDLTPMLVAPLRTLADDDTRECVLMAPTGSGKTSGVVEVGTAWVIKENPANMAVVFHTEKAINKWRESRLMPMLRATKATSDLIPPERSPKNKKEYIQLPSMMLQTIFASPSKLQGDTIKIMLGDEIWEWKPEMLEELRRRNHGQFDYKLMLMSQGGYEGDQLDVAFRNGEIFDWCFKCPSCEKHHRFQWRQVKGWVEINPGTGEKSSVKNEAGEWDWQRIKENCRYECPTEDCKQVWRDNPIERRSMNNDAKYISRDNNHLPGRVSFHFNAMAVWWIPLFELVQGWIVAQEALKQGNKKPLSQFIQKRLAESWEEIIETTELNMGSDAYRMSEYTDGQLWDKETERFMSIDVQKDHFWVLIRAHSLTDGSRLLYAERVETWHGLRLIQRQYKLRNNQVFVDRGFRPDEVAEECFKSKSKTDKDRWWCLLGDGSKGYFVKNKRTKRTECRAVSNYYTARTNSGLQYRYVKFSNLLNKDCLTARMQAGLYGVGVDYSAEYQKQVENEHKIKKPNGTYEYVKVKDWVGNHFFDTEVMQVVATTIYKLISTTTDAE